jgi:rhodanese-related sulfurtransferase
MSTIRLVTPNEAKTLLDEGYRYLDVRSEPEFEAGHPPNALNIPFQHQRGAAFEPNDDFLAVVEANLAKDAPLVIGCKTGSRSRRAAEILAAAGYVTLVELGGGWDGKRDAFGRLQPGWCRSGLPVETGLPDRRRYSALDAKRVSSETIMDNAATDEQ